MAPFLTINTGEEKKVKTVGGIGLDLRIPVPRFLMLATVFFFFKSMTLYRKHVFRFKCQGINDLALDNALNLAVEEMEKEITLLGKD